MYRTGIRVLFYLNGTQQKGTIVSSVVNPVSTVYVIRLLDGGQVIVSIEDIIGEEY